MRLTAWLVDDGAHVEAGEPLFELESDKATQECEAEVAGWVRHELEPEVDVEVGQTIGLIASTEDACQAAATGSTEAATVPVPVSPRAQRALAEHGLDATAVAAWAKGKSGQRLTDRHVRPTPRDTAEVPPRRRPAIRPRPTASLPPVR